MSKIYGRKSEYLIAKKKRHTKRSYILGLCVFILIILDVIFLFNKKYLTEFFALTISVILFFLIYTIGPRIKKEENRSDNFYYGSKGESFIFYKLSQLSNEYLIFQDVKLPDKKYNIDFVVLGPTGIFTIEVKSHRGNIDFNGQKLIRKGIPLHRDFLKQALRQALSFHDYIKNKIKQDIFVKSVLVFSSQYAKLNFNPGLINNVFVLASNDIISFLSKQPRILNSEEIIQLKEILKSLVVSTKRGTHRE